VNFQNKASDDVTVVWI